jgi:predicted RNA-binding protein associated with RNAse of E/G family
MATVIGVGMQMTANAAGMTSGLSEADRALQALQKVVEQSQQGLKRFAGEASGAATAQQKLATDSEFLASAFRTGQINAQQFAEQMQLLAQESAASAAAFAEGSRITAANKTADEQRAAQLDELSKLLEMGAISQETYARAAEKALGVSAEVAATERERQAALAEGASLTASVATAEERRAAELARIQTLLDAGAITEQTAARARADASGESDRLAEAERQLAASRADAARITAANMTPMELYDREVQQLTEHLNAGRITQDTFDRAVSKATATFVKAESAAKGYDKSVDGVGLKFNELSGILSAIPGPIGNFAGRLSGLASAGEGLSRVFSGGLSQGIAGIGSSLASVVNPATLAAAGLAAIGAAASAVVSGLSTLEAETERLQNAADKLGVSFGFIETLEQAASMSGVAFETVNGAMTKLLKTLAGADEESKAATAALDRLGVSLEDIKGKNSEEQLKLIGERLQAIEDPAKRAAAATAIFGKSGAELLPFFENLGVAEQTLNRFNARLSEVDAGRVLALGDSFDAVKASLSGVSNELLTPFIGITQSLSDGLASAIATFGRNIGSVLDIFAPLTSAVGLAGNLFLQFGATLGNIIGTVLEPFALAGRLVSNAIDAISQATTSVAGRVNDAVIGFREFFKFEGLAAAFRDTLAQIGDVVSRVAAIAQAAFARLAEVVGDTLGRASAVVGQAVSQFLEFSGVGDVVTAFSATVSTAFTYLWENIKGIVGSVGGFIEKVLQFAEEWLGIVPEIEQPVVATIELTGGDAIAELVAESKTLKTTLESITKNVGDAISESAKFGQAGFDAALRYQNSIDALKDQLERGLFNEETFRREAEKAGVAFKQELAKIEEGAKLEVQINSEAEKTLDGIQSQIDKAIDGASKFGQAGFDAALKFQDKLKDLGEQFSDGRINANTLADEVARATGEYDKQIAGLKQIQDLQNKTLEDEKARVKELLKESDARTKLEQDISAVLNEQRRTQEEIQRQREAGSIAAADEAVARLAQLDQLQAELETQQQAVEQGFGDGFAKAFDSTNKGIDNLILKAEQFGNVGALAAEALGQGIQRAQEQAIDGILTKETYDREVARQQDLFSQRLAAAQRVEDYLNQGLSQRQRAELEGVAALEKRKKEAAVNVQALEANIQSEQAAIELAREEGRLKDAKAGVERLKQLEYAKKVEQGIVDGRLQVGLQQQQFQNQYAAQQEEIYSIQQQQQQAAAQEQARLAEARRQAEEAEYNRQVARITELNTLGSRTVQTADVRTQEGAALVLGLAANAQDPALIEARLQTKQLQLISKGISQAAANYFNTPVAIVGYSKLG